jgi:hypothetical protein
MQKYNSNDKMLEKVYKKFNQLELNTRIPMSLFLIKNYTNIIEYKLIQEHYCKYLEKFFVFSIIKENKKRIILKFLFDKNFWIFMGQKVKLNDVIWFGLLE